MHLKSLVLAGLVAALALPGAAGEAGDLTREALYAGDLDGGLERLAPLAAADDPEAAFGIGFIHFTKGIEGFANALYRHGLAAPETGPMGPAVAMPIPPNPNPEPLDYAGVRAILEQFVGAMDAARTSLEQGGAAGDYVVLLDPLQVRIDVNGDGRADANESIARVFEQAFGMPSPEVPVRPTTQPTAPSRSRGQGGPLPAPADRAGAPDTTIGFDRADSLWLAGYSQVLASQADFFLAHDFSALVNATFHRLFPRAGLPMQDYATGGMLMLDPQTDTAIADAFAAVHSLNWPVVEPNRLRGVLERGKAILDLSRRNWEAILAETDDQRELVPSPNQTPIVPEGAVTDEVVAAWHATLDAAEKVLDGELLLPHWRFRQGFDLKAYFETATRTDIVMLLTGYDALPYLKDGPIADAASFAEANRVFGDQLLGYIFWFN